ncbi:hypothetical protein Pdw03_0940 [Penicillium digitatum]|uniref:Uncharacterized protein n=1 Tax=Penicillium digitatum TaxID=36651 RepID=A0A7T7BN98_PENDI|nr:hypothetical protein Pdw03_0940 [Penicillium digitatum]
MTILIALGYRRVQYNSPRSPIVGFLPTDEKKARIQTQSETRNCQELSRSYKKNKMTMIIHSRRPPPRPSSKLQSRESAMQMYIK